MRGAKPSVADLPEERAGLENAKHLPWGSVPFGDISSSDRCIGLPLRYLPLTEFLTLTAV